MVRILLFWLAFRVQSHSLGLTNTIPKTEARLTSRGLQSLVYILFLSPLGGVTHHRPSCILPAVYQLLGLAPPISPGNGQLDFGPTSSGVEKVLVTAPTPKTLLLG